jgi:hypothetical protein
MLLENPPVGTPVYPTRGRVVRERESQRPRPIRAVAPGALTGPAGGSLPKSPAQRHSRGRSRGRGRTQILSADRTDSPDAGLLVVRRRGPHGCLGEPRAHRQRDSTRFCRPAPTRGTPAPQNGSERGESPGRRSGSTEAPGGTEATANRFKPAEPCPHIHAHPPPCPQSPLTARAELRDG